MGLFRQLVPGNHRASRDCSGRPHDAVLGWLHDHGDGGGRHYLQIRKTALQLPRLQSDRDSDRLVACRCAPELFSSNHREGSTNYCLANRGHDVAGYRVSPLLQAHRGVIVHSFDSCDFH
ncbi:hypothetical protein D3C76_630670 [compost metagenome]